MVTIDRKRFISEKQNNKVSPEGARLPKGAMLLRDIFKLTKPSLDAFRPFGFISSVCQGPSIYICVYFYLNSYRIVYFVAVQIEIFYDSGKFAVEHCEAK